MLQLHDKLSRIHNVAKIWKRYNFMDYQYLQKSKIPTMHFQRSLPRLPIPKLEHSCERYLAAQKPLLGAEAYRATEKYVREFQQNIGKMLQKQLIDHDKRNKHTSYISEPWFDMYLKERKPLPLNYNPLLVFTNDERPEYNTQLLKATNMLINSLRFYKSLKESILEPEVYHLNPKKSDTDAFKKITSILPSAVSWYGAYLFKAYPLDMSQYNNLFGTTRIPQLDKDRIYHEDNCRHVVVLRNGHFYTFDCLDENGYIISSNKLLACLEHILNDNIPPASHPIGIMTTQDRNIWATARTDLARLGNEENLKVIDSALFTICLDDQSVGTDPKVLTHHFLHGDGTNRWFDKSFSLLLSKDGVAAVNFEHSWGDGVAVLRYFQDIHKAPNHVHPQTLADTKDVQDKVKRLAINLDDTLKNTISESIRVYQQTCNALAVDYVLIDGMGKNFCKKHSISPDGIMQLGFQAAFYKQAGKFVATYESCSTAAFKHGRTETIRPCTLSTKAYCEAITSRSWSKISNAELKSLIVESSKCHGQLTKEAAMGQGFDRHLFALSQLADKNGAPQPDMYRDHCYSAINHNVLSTSTLSSPAVWAGGFGPVIQDGYGIGYTIQNDSLGVLVTTYPPHRNGSDYVRLLQESYQEIEHILKTA